MSTAVAELPTGVTIRLRFADHFLLAVEHEDVDREISILARPTAGAERVESADPRIERPATRRSPWDADCYGVVEELQVDPRHDPGVAFDVLDVGIGSIYVHPSVRESLPGAELPLEVGDELYVPASPVVVWDVLPY